MKKTVDVGGTRLILSNCGYTWTLRGFAIKPYWQDLLRCWMKDYWQCWIDSRKLLSGWPIGRLAALMRDLKNLETVQLPA